MAELLDSGSRRQFESGAVRDIQEGKGRCDLLPLDVLALYFTVNDEPNPVFMALHHYVYEGDLYSLLGALRWFNSLHWDDSSQMFLEGAKQYEDGARKYDERNWEKGLPLHSYIDSGSRHYLKFLRGDQDEPHDRAFVWNMLCAVRTHKDLSTMIDLPFKLKKGDVNNEKISDNKQNNWYIPGSNI